MCTNTKRSLRVVLFVFVSILPITLSTTMVAAQQCLHDGDVDQNGTLTPADALLVFRHFLNLLDPPLDACEQAHANVHDPENSGVTPTDALCIFQWFLELPSCLDDPADESIDPLPPPPPPVQDATPDLTGTWESVFRSNRGSGTLEATLTQDGEMVNGTVVVTSATTLSCAIGTIEGTLQGNVFIATIALHQMLGGGRADLEGILDPAGNIITGSYSVEGGLCDDDQGTWELIRLE